MSSENKSNNELKNSVAEDNTCINVSAKKYSTIEEFKESMEEDDTKKTEEEQKKKEEEETLKQNVLNHWSKILVKEAPKRRTCHTSFIYESYLYIIGGIDITEMKQDDIYKINLKEPRPTWVKVNPSGEELEKIAYHAGAEVNGVYYIIGGQNGSLRTLNNIQPFDINKEELGEKINFEEEKFPPHESHTVNIYNTNLIIYGGMSGKDYNRHVYCFDTQNKAIENLTQNLENDKLPPPRQDHASVIYNDCLYVYGGIGPDSKIYDDMWKFDLKTNTWEELKTEGQKKKEENRKQKEVEKQQKDEEIETEDDEEENNQNEDIRPKGRSGHSMVSIGDVFYIFGGKTGLIKESNELWEFNPSLIEYNCVHQTLLEQFTKEELNRISSENKRGEQKFKWLSRSEVERRTNPSFNDNQKKTEKLKNDKKSKKNTKKKEEKSNQNKELEGKYSEQVLSRPNVSKMRKTLIYTSDPAKIKEGLNTLAKDEKERVNENIQKIKGEIPEPRDGQSVSVDGNCIYLFGGDRFKFPFNDLFMLETEQIPKLPYKEETAKKKESSEMAWLKELEKGIKEKEKELEEKEKKEEENVEEENEEEGENDNNKEEKGKKEEEGRGKDNEKRGEENKTDEEIKKEEEKKKEEEEKKIEEEKKEEERKEEERKEEERKEEERKKQEEEEKKKQEEKILLLREILVYSN